MKNDLMRQLECPVCHTYMVPPIFICENGHNICSNCRPKLEECPMCEKPFTESRNVGLENLARHMHYPCDYRDVGCVEMLPMEQIQSHKIFCPYRPHKCPLAKVPKVLCPWEGSPSEVQGHVLETHERYVDRNVSAIPKPTHLTSVSEEFKDYKVAFHDGKVFLRHVEVKEDNFYCAMVLVGPKEIANEFTYEVKMIKESNAVIMKNVACSNEDDLEEMFESGSCVNLHYKVVKNFMNDENELNLEISFVSTENKCCIIM